MDETIEQRDRANARRLFEYLRALDQALSPLRRDIQAEGQFRLYEGDVAEHPAVSVFTADAWLRVDKVDPPPESPSPSAEVGDWLVEFNPNDSSREPVFDRLAAANEPDGGSAVRHRVEQWVDRVWRPWAADASVTNAARKLYRQLFDLRIELEKEQESIELVLGHGLLSWKVDEETIRHPIAVFPATVSFDEHTGRLVVRQAGDGQLELHFLQAIAAGDERQRSALADEFLDKQIGPTHAERRSELFVPFINSFGLDGSVEDGGRAAPAGRTPILTDTWVLYVRRRATQYQRFFTQGIEAIDGELAVTPAFRALVNDEPSKIPDPWSEDERAAIGSDLLFPKASNSEQRLIAEQLAHGVGVAVQGPPGTGKTHTIANLVSHLIAHGKRVLVASHKPQPLAVLREQLPKELRPLCVADLAGIEGKRQLQDSIDAILEGIAEDPKRAERMIEEARGKLDSARRSIAELTHQLRDVHEADAQTYKLGSEALNSRQLAEWLRANEETLSFVTDRVDPATPSPLTETQFIRLHELLTTTTNVDRTAALKVLPTDPTEASSLAETWARCDEIQHSLSGIADQIADLSMIEQSDPDTVSAAAARFASSSAALAQLQDDWHEQFRDLFRGSAVVRETWTSASEHVTAEIDEIERLSALLLGEDLVMPADPLPASELVEALEAVRDRRDRGKKVGRVLTRGLRTELAKCSVGGRSLDRADPPIEDVERLLVHAEMLNRRHRLARYWNDIISGVHGPVCDAAHVERSLQPLAVELAALVAWETEERSELLELAGVMHLPLGVVETPAALGQTAEALETALLRFEQRQLQKWLADLAAYIDRQRGEANASPLLSSLAEALATRDISKWETATAEVRRLAEIAPRAAELEDLLGQLREVAPHWASRLEADETGTPFPPERALDAWEWRRANTWHEGLLKLGDTAAIQAQIEEQQRVERQELERLVSQSAWLRLRETVTEPQKKALRSYAGAMKRLGKGKGKFAPQYRREARMAMTQAQGAVPVWIMPVYSAVDTFEPMKAERFDVLITDESSQCDVRSAALLSLADKVVVVGDDKQIAPAMVGVAMAPVFALQRQYLEGHISAPGMFGAKASLYEMATGMFPGTVMLKEHFRCLPEIIGYSNQLCYRGEIRPLREALDIPQWKPVQDVFIPSGYREEGTKINVPEQEHVVELVEWMVKTPAYRDKTIGVISLLGSDQARQISDAIQARIGEIEFERRRIRCGDAYHFQGDERDVMLLTMVVDTHSRLGGFSVDGAEQRINVAASRAKDQMWLIRSINAADLSVNDVRRSLIEYCSDPSLGVAREAAVLDRTESPFERLVAERLVRAGYDVQAQYEVGSYRLDFVVRTRSGRKRMAVECDGEAYHGPEQWEDDMARQRTLERLGWRFHRIRGAAFYRDPDSAMQALFEALERLDLDSEEPDESAPESVSGPPVPVVALSAGAPPVRSDDSQTEGGVDQADERQLSELAGAVDQEQTVDATRDTSASDDDPEAAREAARQAREPIDRKRRAPKKSAVKKVVKSTRPVVSSGAPVRSVAHTWRFVNQAVRRRFPDVEIDGRGGGLELSAPPLFVRCRESADTVVIADVRSVSDDAAGRRSALVARHGVVFDDNAREWAQKLNVSLFRLNESDRPVAINPPAEALLREMLD